MTGNSSACAVQSLAVQGIVQRCVLPVVPTSIAIITTMALALAARGALESGPALGGGTYTVVLLFGVLIGLLACAVAAFMLAPVWFAVYWIASRAGSARAAAGASNLVSVLAALGIFAYYIEHDADILSRLTNIWERQWAGFVAFAIPGAVFSRFIASSLFRTPVSG